MSETPSRAELLEFLSTADFFAGLDPDDVKALLTLIELRHHPAGAVIFRQGDQGDAWAVVYRGRVEVRCQWPDGSEHVLAKQGPRACVGEMAVLEDRGRLATVTALDDVVLVHFPRGPFQARIDAGDVPALRLAYAVARALSGRIREMNLELSTLKAQAGGWY